MLKNNWIRLLIALTLPQLVGAIGSLFTLPAIPSWYASLNKPNFTPPSWLFGPAWTLLYLLMGIALYLVWGQKTKQAKTALKLFWLQLILNGLWSIVFFGLRSPLLAFIEIVALWVVLVFTTKKFYQLSQPAGLLLVPYLLWVSFAAVLNFAIVRLN